MIKNEINIAIDCRLLDKLKNTGISRYTEFLIEYYMQKYPTGIITLIVNEKDFYYKNCVSIYTPFKPFNIYHYIRFYYKFKNINFNLFHSPFYSSFIFPTAYPICVTVHDLMYKLVPSFFSSNKFISFLKIKYYDFLVKTSLNSATTIISVSRTTQIDVFKVFNKKSTFIPENSEVLAIPDFSILERYELKKNTYFFYCGNSRPHKNLKILYETFENSKDLPPLILAGNNHKPTTNVINVGLVSDEELKALYIGSIGFIFPSFYEGFGLPILESLYSKTIVVASNIPAFKEFKNKNIYFFNPYDSDDLLSVLKEVLLKTYIQDEEFFIMYSNDNIRSEYDKLIEPLLFIK